MKHVELNKSEKPNHHSLKDLFPPVLLNFSMLINTVIPLTYMFLCLDHSGRLMDNAFRSLALMAIFKDDLSVLILWSSHLQVSNPRWKGYALIYWFRWGLSYTNWQDVTWLPIGSSIIQMLLRKFVTITEMLHPWDIFLAYIVFFKVQWPKGYIKKYEKKMIIIM